MQVTSRLAQRLDRLDDRYRWARLEPQGLVATGRPPEPIEHLDQVAADHVDWSKDPAKGDRVDEKSLQEAAVAVLAEHLGVLSELQRESTGHSEFVDGQQQAWDVKSPVSPDREGWIFDPHHHLEVLREDLGQGEAILLDLSRLRKPDATSLLSVLHQGLEVQERNQVLVLLEAELVN